MDELDKLFLELLKEDYKRRSEPILRFNDVLWSWLQKEGESLWDGVIEYNSLLGCAEDMGRLYAIVEGLLNDLATKREWDDDIYYLARSVLWD
ncbi:hypothetical protein [Bacillus paranthracis]|uniref:hypothetical protein n=1 Tax=Bacillus paranthracis TaxID=2026186 RepID=UPI0010AC3467|nr:hypothetical protein [Bacillus paranthracis]TKC15607.1 hypothetical protein CQB03_26690 [Bacillus paranthracis]